MAQGSNCSAILVEEPTEGFIKVSYRVGSSHPLHTAAGGLAILSNRPASTTDSEAVRLARQQGYSITQGELQRGAIGIAVPLKFPTPAVLPEYSIGVVALEDLNVELATQHIQAIATRLVAELAQS